MTEIGTPGGVGGKYFPRSSELFEIAGFCARNLSLSRLRVDRSDLNVGNIDILSIAQ